MQECCQTAKQDASSADKPGPKTCPGCGSKGRRVATLTVKNLVRDHTRVLTSASFMFCRSVDCEVVYFAGEAVFNKPDLKVRVGIKETADPIPLCYCFGYTREDILRDIVINKSTAVPEKIKAEVQGGFCGCEVKNPSGTCCLGDISRVVRNLQETSR